MSTQQPSSRGADASLRPMPVVRYAALSKASNDPGHESIESQLAAVRKKQEQEYGEEFLVVGEFSDDGYSGSKRNRGPGLEAAIEAAERAVAQHGYCELWANTPARFGRGSGRRNEARSLRELSAAMDRAGVGLRTVIKNEFVTNQVLIGFVSEEAHQYSQELSEAVARAKLRQLAAGEHLGGPTCDGYRMVPRHDDQGHVIGRAFSFDPDRADVWRTIFALAHEGMPDTSIARTMNAEGKRTKNGRPFDRRAIQNGLTNPFYAGRIAYKRGTPDEQIVDGRHPALVEPSVYDQIQAARNLRDRAPDTKVIGRPAENHALARLALCGRCRERLYAQTSTYRRQDGSRSRTYICHASKFGTGLCDARPMNAELVDAAVLANLDTLLVDFDRWRSHIVDKHESERERVKDEVRRAQADHDKQATRTAKVEAKWAQYVVEDEQKADLVLPMVERERDALDAAKRRLQAAEDALASIPTDAPTDAMLDFANALQQALRGRLDGTESMKQVNGALRDLFACFVVYEKDETTLTKTSPGHAEFRPTGRRQLVIEPYLLAAVVESITWRTQARSERTLFAGDEPPPLRWLTSTPASPVAPPDGNGPNPHEPWHYGFVLNAGSTSLGYGDADGRGAVPSFVPPRFAPALARAAQRWNVSAALLAAQLHAESGFDPDAVSPAGAQGIAQFMPATARAYGLADPFDAPRAIDAQGRLMRDLLRRFGSVPLALAAYNAGPGPVAACGCVPPYPETRAYVTRILGLLRGAGDSDGLLTGLEVRLVR